MAQAITVHAHTEIEKDQTGEGGQCRCCNELIFREGFVIMIHYDKPASWAGKKKTYCKLCQSCGSELKRMREEQQDDNEQNLKAHGQPCWN